MMVITSDGELINSYICEECGEPFSEVKKIGVFDDDLDLFGCVLCRECLKKRGVDSENKSISKILFNFD